MELRPHRIIKRKKTREIKVGKVLVGGKSIRGKNHALGLD